MAGEVFVGREPELKALQQFLGKATAAKTQVVFVAGEAGAGKSALVNEFVRRTEEADPNVVAAIGECNAQTGAGDAYLAFRQVLTVLSGAQDEKETSKAINATNAARLKELVRVSGETLFDIGPDLIGIFVPGAALFTKLATRAATNSKLASKLAERMGKSDKGAAGPTPNPQLDQEKIFQQYAAVVQALAREHTLILILDDLQWADSASLNLLFHLARQLKESRVLLVGTYRSDDVALGRGGERHPLEPILNELKRYYGDIVIDLGAAQATEGRAFVDALVDAEPNRLAAEFRNELFARTEGHPLFTVELLRNLQERGDIVKDAEGKWVQSATLDWEAMPARVEGVIEERIARLEDNLRETLNIGSVVGYDFAAQVVARVQQVQERELLKSLTRELEKRHRLVLEQGETRVGKQFLSQYRFIHALFQQFLYNQLGVGERRMMHGEVADALEQLYAEHSDEIAVQLALHYQEAGDDEKTAEYAIRAGDHAGRLSAEPEAGAHYTQALQALSRLPDTDENRRAHIDTLIKRTAVSFTSASPEQHLANLREAESLVEILLCTDAPSSADRLRLARVHAWSARMHFFRQERRAALEDFRQVLPVAQDLGDEELAALASTNMARIWLWEGEFGRALPLLQQALSVLEQRQNWTEWILTHSLIGVALAARGDYHAGVEEAERALTRAKELRHLNGTAIAYVALAIIHLLGGAIQPTLEASRAAVQMVVPSENEMSIFNALGTQAWAESRLGEHQAARESMAKAEAVAQKLGGHLFFDDWLAAIKVEMALNARQIQETLTRAEEAMSFVRSVDGKFAEAMVQRAWGKALAALDPPQWEEAETHLASSLELFASGGAVLEAARTHVAWGNVLRARGDAEASREHFEKAAAQFQASGLTSELEQTKHLIDSPST